MAGFFRGGSIHPDVGRSVSPAARHETQPAAGEPGGDRRPAGCPGSVERRTQRCLQLAERLAWNIGLDAVARGRAHAHQAHLSIDHRRR